MAVRYVRSTDGSDTDNGTTWALAKATLTGVAAIDTAGDTIWISQNHAESTASALSFAWAGTRTSPTRIVCGNDGAEPPTALATTATVTSSSGTSMILASSAAAVYYYGLTFIASGTLSTTGIKCNNSSSFVTYENCAFQITGAGATGLVQLAFSGHGVYRNCTFKFSHAGQAASTDAEAEIIGGSYDASGTEPTYLFKGGGSARTMLKGFDMSGLSSSSAIFSMSADYIAAVECKLPVSWTGVPVVGVGPVAIVEMFNCDSGDTHYRYRKYAASGNIVDETTLVRTGGANDGVTTYSYKMATGTDAAFPGVSLDTPELVKWNDTTGSAITATVEILRDSATNLTDQEIWIEVMYLGTSGVPLASFINDSSSVVATAADQAASSETWTTTGMSNPNKQKLSVTFTPQEAGFIHAVVKLAKASTTVYVDPKITVT